METWIAWEIVKTCGALTELNDEQRFIYEEALNCIVQEALEKEDSNWKDNAIAGTFNLAYYYETIKKYDLAIKYYELSAELGEKLARKRIEEIKTY